MARVKAADSVATAVGSWADGDVSTRERDSAERLREYLHRGIVSNQLAAGTELNQLQLAQMFKISRGPVREALRLLQGQGLVTVERNYRWKVAPIDPEDVHAVYAERVLLEAIGITLTVKRLSKNEVAEAKECIEEMERQSKIGFEGYWRPHSRFHHILVSGLPTPMLARSDALRDRTERYQRFYVDKMPARDWAAGRRDHVNILRAAERGNTQQAAEYLAEHYAKTGYVLLKTLDPARDPEALNVAMNLVYSGTCCAELPAAFARG